MIAALDFAPDFAPNFDAIGCVDDRRARGGELTVRTARRRADWPMLSYKQPWPGWIATAAQGQACGPRCQDRRNREADLSYLEVGVERERRGVRERSGERTAQRVSGTESERREEKVARRESSAERESGAEREWHGE